MNLRRFALPVKVTLTLAMGFVLLRQVDLVELGRLARAFSAQSLLLAAALMVLQALLLAWRWQRLLRFLGQPLRPKLALRWVLVGLFFNQALPTSVGGDAFRVWALHRHGTAPGTAFASVALERVTGVTLMALMIALCVPTLQPGLPAGVAWALMASAPALVAALAVIALADRLPLQWLPAAILASLTSTSGGLRRLLASPSDTLGLSLLAIAASLCGFGAAWVLGRSLGIEQQPLSAVVVVLGGAMLVSLLPISLGGWGVREATVVALFTALGVAPERALAMSVAFGLLQLAVSLPGGMLWWIDERGPAVVVAAAPPQGSRRPRP